MEINLLKAMNHPNIVNHPQRVPWAQRALGPGRRWARGPGASYGGPRRPGPRALWAHGALWGWLTMFGWFIAFSKLISIYLSRYILLYMDSGLFGTFRAHIKDCEVLLRFQVGKQVDKSSQIGYSTSFRLFYIDLTIFHVFFKFLSKCRSFSNFSEKYFGLGDLQMFEVACFWHGFRFVL